MTLSDWLRAESRRRRGTQLALREQAAQATGIHPNTVWQVANGKPCSPRLAAGLSSFTAGAVSVQELLYPSGVPAGASMVPVEVVSEPA